MAKKAATPTTVTLKHLAAAIADDQELSKKKAEEILNDLVTRITKHLKKGERIRIVGLGILQVRKRAARMGRNPATGEAIHIKASKKVAFRAAKELKEAVCPTRFPTDLASSRSGHMYPGMTLFQALSFSFSELSRSFRGSEL
jgi:DNA-binding protein HU-beta